MKKMMYLFALLFCGVSASAQQEILLYPQGAAESNNITEDETKDRDNFVTNITQARMYAYLAPAEKATGAAVLICPGGGYAGICVDKEGTEFASWLNNLGIAAFVLYYRMPNGNNEIPLKDAQTAMETIRMNAKAWNINKSRIGIAGFSAGGHLASTAGTHFTKINRPDFMILIYPVITLDPAITHMGTRNNLLGSMPSKELQDKYSNELQVTKQTPPAFVLATTDDGVVPVKNSELFVESLKEHKIKYEFKTYEKGGHGFGLRKMNLPVDNWLNDLQGWLKLNKYIK